VSKSGVVENIMNWVKFKAKSELNKKSAAKSSKLKGKMLIQFRTIATKFT